MDRFSVLFSEESAVVGLISSKLETRLMLWAWDWMAMQQQCGMDGNVDSNMDCNVAAMCNVDGNVGGLDGSSAAAGGETWLRSSGDSHGSQIHTHWGEEKGVRLFESETSPFRGTHVYKASCRGHNIYDFQIKSSVTLVSEI